MASAMYSEAPASRLSISLENSTTASPFPSPSSSFLPPPTPGAHEFAVKPAPPTRAARKASTPSLLSPAASPRSSVQVTNPETPLPNSGSPLTTPTNHTMSLPPTSDLPRLRTSKINSRPLSTASTTSSTASYASAGSSSSASFFDPSLFSTRPAPPSPGGGGSSPSLSRKISTASTRSKQQPAAAGSKPVSRANSLRKGTAGGGGSPTLGARVEGAAPCSSSSPHLHHRHHHQHQRASVGSQLSQSFSLPSPLASPSKPHFEEDNNNMGISPSSVALPETVAVLPSTVVPGGTLSERSSGSPSTTSSTTTTTATTSSSSLSTHPSIDHHHQQPEPEQPPQAASADDQKKQEDQDQHPKPHIKIRDFAFQQQDERHKGLGPLVPKSNRVGRMNARLACGDGTVSSSEDVEEEEEEEEEEEDEDGWGWGMGMGMGGYTTGMNGYGSGAGGGGGGGVWGGFKMGMGRFGWTMNNDHHHNSSGGPVVATAATIFDQERAYDVAARNLSAAAKSGSSSGASGREGGYPTRSDMDRNFLDSESEEYYDAEDDYCDPDDSSEAPSDDEEAFRDVTETQGQTQAQGQGGEEEEPLYPGLYRAMYAFEPEGTAEMRLVEDQIVRVVGRGGGVGWAVVVVVQEEEEEEEGVKTTVTTGGGGEGQGEDGEGFMRAPKHALVPEGYLEPYKLDWELEDVAVGVGGGVSTTTTT